MMNHWKTGVTAFFAGVMVTSLLVYGISDHTGKEDEIGPDTRTKETNQHQSGEELPPFSQQSVAEAEKLYGLSFSEAQRDSMMDGLLTSLDFYQSLREMDIGNEVIPALQFNPLLPGRIPETEQFSVDWKLPESVEMPDNFEELAFYPVEKLAVLIRNRKISSLELTQLYLDRIRRYDDQLKTVITLTEDLAIRQAERADKELAEGTYHGPLHGIPYGTKDLLALEGYPTTWGSVPYKDQIIDETATVIQKLEAAGAVHLGKLSLGELAWGDVWFGGMTRTPWNTELGSSGSSAGPASGTAAGLMAFAIGSETLGSIVSPCTQNGVNGLRPTYGRVSRHGAMALSWSMDKIGPITRSAHDAALVFNAIHGPLNSDDVNPDSGEKQHPALTDDPYDPTVYDLPFNYNPDFDFEKLTIGYVESAFKMNGKIDRYDQQVFDVLEELGADLVPVELPEMPVGPLRRILSVEAAAAFDELTRSGRDTLMVRQIKNAWPNVFRTNRFVPAVEYIQANRARTLLMQQMEEAISGVDVYIAPSFAGSNLLITNLTGHPSVVVPTGFEVEAGIPVSITFNGHLFDEGTVLALARAYQSVTSHHRRIPDGFLE